MKNTNRVYLAITLGFFILYSFSSNPPQGRTGAPGEPTCASSTCHSINPGIRGLIRIEGLPQTIEPSTNYSLKLNLDVTSGRAFRGGFQMTILDKNNNSIGTLINPGESSMVSASNNREYFEHEPAKNFNGDTIVTYSVVWSTPPELKDDTITIYATSILSNGDGGSSLDGFVQSTLQRFTSAPDQDEDMDGFNKDVDCDDNNPDINPDATEILDNDIDENCDGLIEMSPDADMDGFKANEDCDDNNPDINPNAAEIPDNNIDENCDGIIEQTTSSAPFFYKITSFAGDGIGNVRVALTDKDSTIAISDTNGLIAIPPSLSGQNVQFSKMGKAADGISTIDLVLISNHIIGRNIIIEEAKLDAADANNSGSISAADLVQFKNILLGKWDSLPSREPWAFMPANSVLPANNTNDTILIQGYKIGDLNGSADPN